MLLAISGSVAARRLRFAAYLICFGCLGLYVYPLTTPQLVQDDFQILACGATWPRTLSNLWVPQNEHAMPLGRLLTWCLMRVGGRAILLPWTAGLVGPLALLAALPLVYLFVRRELGHPLYGLVAAALFGVSSVYQQAVYWFAAAFSILALDTMLLGLLAAQRWRLTGCRGYLFLSALACLLAPAWFASGVLAGPLCGLYLLGSSFSRERSASADKALAERSRLNSFVALFPMLGTAVFLAISLPFTARYIQHLGHYQGRTMTEAFNPLVGLGYTARSIVDNLVLGVAGVSTVETPIPLVVAVLLLLAGSAYWWWQRAPEQRLLLLGLGMIGSAYLLVYSARSVWPYEGLMTQPGWSRYHLLPQLGLALFISGGLPAWRFDVERDGLTRRQGLALLLLVGGLFLIQLPRALLGYFIPMPGIERFARNEEERQRLIEARDNLAAQRDAAAPCGRRGSLSRPRH